MFDSCTSLSNVTIPDTVASIGQFAFYGCSSLVEVTIPDSVTSLGGSAFGYCYGLTRIYFLGNAPSINEYAFVGSNIVTIYYVAGTTGWGPTFGGRPTVASYPPGPYTCTTNNATIRITGYSGPGGAVTIPGAINGLPVTSIGDLAFYRCSSLTNITIPDSVTNIGDFAFACCFSLTGVTIPNGVTTIGEAAFDNCINLTNVLVPDSVTSIGSAAFYDCANLTGVTIGNSVASLGDYTFYGCSSLARVNFRGNAPSIGFEEFSCTASNATVYYLSGTTGWGPAFGGHPAVLWNPPVPYTYLVNNGAITITGYIGSDSAATIRNTIDFLPVTSIGDAAFQNLSSLTTIVIPDSVTNIGIYAFEECAGLSGITIPSSVTTIPDFAFQYCSGLTSVTMGTDITSIGDNAFYSCFGLTSVTIPDSVTSLGDQAFGLCGGLTNITVGNSVAYIDDSAFIFCSSVTGIYFRGNAPTIASADVFEGDNATAYYLPGTSGWGSWLYSYYAISSVMLNPPVPAGSLQVTITPAGAGAAGARWQVDDGILQPSGATVLGLSVGNHTVSFSAVSPWTTPANQTVCVSANSTATATGICTEPVQYQLICRINADRTLAITGYTADLGGAVAIPSTINGRVVTGIGDWAFENCYNLTSVMIPASVTNIGLPPFGGCSGLTAITVDTDNPNYSSLNGVLFDKSQTTLIECPGGLANCLIPDSVTSIAYQAFNSCSGLTSVTFGNRVTSIGDWAFGNCLSLTGVYFQGNAPTENWSAFSGDHATAYYLPGTLGWGSSFSTLPTAQWFLPNPVILNTSPSFGAQSNGFGFIISWATNVPVVVEACGNLATPIWSPLETNTLSNGSSYFSDPQWTNYPTCFYRLRWP
jgi:hypothetical protein